MARDFVSLAVIALVAAAAPIIANLIPRKPIPETVLLLADGAVLGPAMLNVIRTDENVMLLSDHGSQYASLLLGRTMGTRASSPPWGRSRHRGITPWRSPS